MKKKDKEIDFVVLWVDSNDLAWQKKKALYLHGEDSDVSVNRYRDWDNLKYWFRGVAKFAPFVRKIHFVSDGQVPKWLDVTNERIHIVDHKDYMPKECLPVFNSSAIEIGLHRIEDLSEHFVFFNDDMFLTSEITPDYFFKEGVPIDIAGLTRRCDTNSMFGCIMMNNYSIINKYYDKNIVLKNNIKLWFNPFYNKTFIRTMLNISRKEFDGLIIPHLSVPYRKSDFKRVWDKEENILTQIQYHRFRQSSDLTHFLFRFWRMCEGDFYSRNTKGKYFSINSYESAELASQAISKKKYPEVCLNDCYEGENFEQVREIINKSFEKILSDKCEFEI